MQHNLQINEKYDMEFINLILEIEKKFVSLAKHDKLKIESWVKKLCIPTNNKEWKKNRNLHAILMLDMILNNKIEEPYNKFVNEMESVCLLSKTVVRSRLSEKFEQEIMEIQNDKNLDEFSHKLGYKFVLNAESDVKLKETKKKLRSSK